jgi:hypothetical protein
VVTLVVATFVVVVFITLVAALTENTVVVRNSVAIKIKNRENFFIGLVYVNRRYK